MENAVEELTRAILGMDSLRRGADFFECESQSVKVLEILLNQRVGIDCASAVNLAIHDHFERPFAERIETVGEVSAFPYEDIPLRVSAKRVFNKIVAFESNLQRFLTTRISALPSGILGALVALERYHNRENHYFDALRALKLNSRTLARLSAEAVYGISPVRLPVNNLEKQLASSASVLEMLEAGGDCDTEQLRKKLLRLDRVGQETADTLLVYVFERRAIIVDDYLRRIFYRHFALSKMNFSRRHVLELISDKIATLEMAHRIHARTNEIGEMYCLATKPFCDSCPLSCLRHQQQ